MKTYPCENTGLWKVSVIQNKLSVLEKRNGYAAFVFWVPPHARNYGWLSMCIHLASRINTGEERSTKKLNTLSNITSCFRQGSDSACGFMVVLTSSVIVPTKFQRPGSPPWLARFCGKEHDTYCRVCGSWSCLQILKYCLCQDKATMDKMKTDWYDNALIKSDGQLDFHHGQ